MKHNTKLMTVNEEIVTVLAVETNSNKLNVEYIPLSNPNNLEYEKVIRMLDDPDFTAKDIIQYIRENEEFNWIFNHFSFCRNLFTPFQDGISSIQHLKDEEIYKLFIDKSEDEIEKKTKNEKKSLIGEVRSRYLAFCYAKTYDRCDSDENIKAYSHRNVGWNLKKFDLNKSFIVQFVTNFGYGSSSYFYVQIKYKGLLIIPYSDLVVYRNANAYQITSYSEKYPPDYDNWKFALEYAKNACNLAIENENDFVNRYIIKECEKMVNGLEKFIEQSTFQFIDFKRNSYSQSLEGHELIIFRGEKITGALDFVRKIIEFEPITHLSNYANRILQMNIAINPILNKERLIIEKNLHDLQVEIELKKKKFKRASTKLKIYQGKAGLYLIELNTQYDNAYDDFYELPEYKFIEKYPTLTPFEELVFKEFPEYPGIIKTYENLQNEIENLSSKITKMEEFLNTISGYQQKIETFFTENSEFSKNFSLV
jgi:hypothetical protein